MPKNTPVGNAPLTVSPALLFLTTARGSLPKGIGDRDWHAFMSGVMGMAIDTKMIFDSNDGKALDRLSSRCQYGVFSPIGENWYIQACRVGGTYCRMYEKAVGLAPWIAPLTLPQRNVEHPRVSARVAPRIGVVLPKTENDDPTAEKTRAGDQVWWCTSLTNDQIILCRYRQSAQTSSDYGNGPPIKRWKLTRAEWKELHATEAVAVAND